MPNQEESGKSAPSGMIELLHEVSAVDKHVSGKLHKSVMAED